MKWLAMLLVGLLVFSQYELWLSPGGMLNALRLKQSISKQEHINSQAKKRNDLLRADIKDLKSGNQAVEERARRELGMVKKGEVFYQVVK
mgnify:CR=1 FL=1